MTRTKRSSQTGLAWWEPPQLAAWQPEMCLECGHLHGGDCPAPVTALPPGLFDDAGELTGLGALVEEAANFLAARCRLDPEAEAYPYWAYAQLAALAAAGPCEECGTGPLNGSNLADHYEARLRDEFYRLVPVWTCDCGEAYKVLREPPGAAFYKIAGDGLLGDLAGTVKLDSKRVPQVKESDPCPGCGRMFAETLLAQRNRQQAEALAAPARTETAAASGARAVPGQLRDTTVALCAEFTRAESDCFKAWCAVADGRRPAAPEAIVASQAALHEAARRMRAWCLADPDAAEAERRTLMRLQAEGEITAVRARKARRSAGDRQGVQQAWNGSRSAIISQRDALTCGLGWPHRGEQVIVTAWRYGADGEKVPVTGEGIYFDSCDVFNAGHSVWVPSLGPRRDGGSLRIEWEPNGDKDGHLGPADPAGDIGIRLLAVPGRKLPVPLERWPGLTEARRIDVPPPPAAQPAMFTAPRVTGRPASGHDRPAHEEQPGPQLADDLQALF